MSHRLATQVWVDVSKDTARAWNAARESGYTDEMWVVCYWFEDVPRTHLNLVSPTRFLDLWGRFETPNERARWDAPLFRPLDTSASRDDSEDYHGDYGVEPLPEGAKDVLGADFIDSTSCGPGGGGSDTASGVAADPAPHGGSGGGAAGAAAAAGSGAGGSAGAGAGASAPAPRAESGDATGVPATAGTDAGMALLPYDDIVAALLDSKKDTKLNHSTIKVPGVSVCRWGRWCLIAVMIASQTPLSDTNLLHQLDKVTQDVVSALSKAVRGAMVGDVMRVPGGTRSVRCLAGVGCCCRRAQRR